jgi:hypothetical protein
MGKSKKDLAKGVSNLKRRIEELESKVKLDPARKNPAIHDELSQLKKKLSEM